MGDRCWGQTYSSKMRITYILIQWRIKLHAYVSLLCFYYYSFCYSSFLTVAIDSFPFFYCSLLSFICCLELCCLLVFYFLRSPFCYFPSILVHLLDALRPFPLIFLESLSPLLFSIPLSCLLAHCGAVDFANVFCFVPISFSLMSVSQYALFQQVHSLIVLLYLLLFSSCYQFFSRKFFLSVHFLFSLTIIFLTIYFL